MQLMRQVYKLMNENYAEKAILSVTLGGDKGLTYDSKNNLILSGVKVVSSGSIDLKGKNVEINPLETKSYNKHKEVKRGFSGSFSPKGISVSYGKDKFSSDTDILNNASKVVGAIKDGVAAINSLMNYKYVGTDSTGAETLKNKPCIFNASISYNKSKSKSSVHNETVEKSSLVAGRNMNIKSKNGNISISGTDVKVGNDLDLSAKKDIVIKASEENYTSSSLSSQTGISLSANLEEGRIADLSVSQAGTRARRNGTNYINSTVNVGGKLKTNSENLTLSGANVEADKLDIKAKNVVIESKQDKSERKDRSYGGSFSIDIVNPSNFSVSVNGSKGSGEKGWVNKQSSLITKNGGKIDTDSLTNIGGELLFDDNKKFIGIRVSGGLTKDIDEVKLELPPNVYGSVDNSIITSSKFIKKSKKEIEKQIGYDLDRISELAKDKITAIKNAVIIAGIIKRISEYMEELENGGNKRSMWRSRSI